MDETGLGEINQSRRSFFGGGRGCHRAAQLGTIGAANAEVVGQASAGAGAHTSFRPLNQIEAGVLNVGYAEDGPVDGPVAAPARLALRHL